MKALTVKRPWANLIASGQKTIELRTWAPSEVPCRIAIHAGQAFDRRGTEFDDNLDSIGNILCTVEVRHVRPATYLDCVAACLSSAHLRDARSLANSKGRQLLAWELRNAEPIAPTYHIGKLGLWQLP